MNSNENPTSGVAPKTSLSSLAKASNKGKRQIGSNPTPARRGRPPLTEKERQERQQLRAGKKPKQSDNPPVALCVAQRVLGIDYGEGSETVENAAPLPFQRLPTNVKQFIVMRNACLLSPREVIQEVRETFGFSLTSAQIARYDPTRVAGQTLRDEYKMLYAETRREYEMLVQKIGICSQKWRLTTMHNLCVKALDSGSVKVALQIMDQAAKEQGGHYVKAFPRSSEKSTLEEKRILLARLLKCEVSQLPPVRKPGELELTEGEAQENYYGRQV